MTTWRDIAGFLTGRRSKVLVLVLWLALASALTPLALKLTEVQDNTGLGGLPPGVEAEVAQRRAETAFPEPNNLDAIVVYARDSGLTPGDERRAGGDRAAFAPLAVDADIPPPQPSDDGRALLLRFLLTGTPDEQSTAVETIRARLATDPPDGLAMALTGTAGSDADLADAFAGLDTTLLLVTAAAVALLLLITYRSPVLWLLVFLVVAVASQVANGIVYLLATYAGLTVDFQSQSILTVLVVGVGVDYALLLIARYREELRRHTDRHEAMAVALRRSFAAILASAATVALALLCLLAAAVPSTHSLGPVGAIGVTATLVAMTTLMPAVLVLFGRWLFWPFTPRYSPTPRGRQVDAATAGEAETDHGLWRRIAGGVGRRPRLAWLATTAVLVGLCFGAGKLSLGLPGDGYFTQEVASVTGQRLIAAHYGDGATGPTDIIAAPAAGDRVADAVRGLPGVAEVAAPETSAQWARVRVTLTDAADSPGAETTVDRLRAAVHAIPGADAVVGGKAAALVDNDRTVDRDNRVIMPLILLVVFIVLVVLLRAVVAPLLLMASVVLTYAASLGAAGLILDALGYPGLWVALPLQVFLFLVALGVDYTVFLMTRAREEVARRGHRAGVLTALTVTGGVITSAGVVLAATFAALAVLPLVPSVQTGVIVAAGVLLDTFLVRTVLIPALALHIGRTTWWPGRLAQAPSEPKTADQVPVPVG